MYNTNQAALYLKISISYLRNMRCQGYGPEFTQVLNKRWMCYYTKEALDSWAASHEFKRDKKSEVDILKGRIADLEYQLANARRAA